MSDREEMQEFCEDIIAAIAPHVRAGFVVGIIVVSEDGDHARVCIPDQTPAGVRDLFMRAARGESEESREVALVCPKLSNTH